MKTLKRHIFPVLVLALFALIAGAKEARAGFGISPPYVKNNQIIPGSHYEQQIMLLRSSSEEDLKAEVTVNAPDIASWISIDKGNSFILPKGALQVPMVVRVDAPANAEVGNYKGYINVKISPVTENNAGGVAIALGARIDIDLTLTNVTFSDFLVRFVSIPEVERLGKPFNWKYWAPLFDKLFYRIAVVMNIQNTGNVETAPSKVRLESYDLTENKLLESSEVTNIKKIKSFSTDQTEAFFPTNLPVGQYWGKIKIYKDNEIVNSYKIAFTITEPGALGGKARDLGAMPWVVFGSIILAGLIIIGILIKIKVWKYFIALLAFFLRPIWRIISGSANSLKSKFWRWIGQKAQQKTGKFDK